MRINRVNLKFLRNEEWFRLHCIFASLVDDCGVERLKLQRLFPLYKKICKEVEDLLGRSRKSFISIEVTEADKVRTQQFRALRWAVKACLKLNNGKENSTAMQVRTLVKKHEKTILKGGMAGKTTAIANLVHEFQQLTTHPDPVPQDEIRGIPAWIHSLRTANRAYIEAVDKRLQEAAKRPGVNRLKTLRRQADRYYIRMIDLVASELQAISPPTPRPAPAPAPDDASVLHFAKALNVCVTYYKTILKGRQTKKEKKEANPLQHSRELPHPYFYTYIS
ncbi:MAG: DUF6261 family protein [Tannerellaceae bacterium]|jgi:hypothetical protein|nr:DUF6261 family protein [Tannerellaceae bacterium]